MGWQQVADATAIEALDADLHRNSGDFEFTLSDAAGGCH
jgi:hypothetical protein